MVSVLSILAVVVVAVEAFATIVAHVTVAPVVVDVAVVAQG